MKRLRRVACVCVGVLLLDGGLARAATFSVGGRLPLSDTDANATRAYAFATAASSTVVIQSYGYGGTGAAAGGVNLAERVIPPGGFDPYVSLFAGSGDAATFLASNDDGSCPPAMPDAGTCGDSRLSLSLPAGRYTLVIAAFENQSLAENRGAGTLGDGFVGLGNYDASRSTGYALDISGSGIDEVFRNDFE